MFHVNARKFFELRKVTQSSYLWLSKHFNRKQSGDSDEEITRNFDLLNIHEDLSSI